jgi:late competence protein required for DNA uptake (superfamily II DNA/RNA helicase)
MKNLIIKKNIKELINRLDSNKMRCPICKKWKNKKEIELVRNNGYKYFCTSCWKRATKNCKNIKYINYER